MEPQYCAKCLSGDLHSEKHYCAHCYDRAISDLFAAAERMRELRERVERAEAGERKAIKERDEVLQMKLPLDGGRV